jgi:hypothetical protein
MTRVDANVSRVAVKSSALIAGAEGGDEVVWGADDNDCKADGAEVEVPRRTHFAALWMSLSG